MIYSLMAFLFFADTTLPISCPTPQIQHGKVKAGAKLEATFVLKNHSDRPIRLGVIKGSCGCLQPTLAKNLLAAGESTSLLARFNTLALAEGPHTWRLEVPYRFDDRIELQAEEPKLTLIASATIIREIQLEPVSIAIITDGAAEESIRLIDHRSKPLSIRSIKSGSVHIEAKRDLNSTQSNHLIQLQVHESIPAGTMQDWVVVETDDPEYPELKIPIQITRKDRQTIQASPDQLVLRFSKGQQTSSGLIQLRSPAEQAIKILKIVSDSDRITHRYATSSTGQTTLRLTVTLLSNAESGMGKVVVHFAEPAGQMIIIPVSWQVPTPE
jgi:hypothetical protein